MLLGKSQVGDFSDFRISGQSFINKNCQNSRNSHGIDMKLGTVTKLDKKYTTTSIKFDDEFMSKNCGTIILLTDLRLI